MPRCYMVKKGAQQRHEGPPPCSPTEASVAPPCYSPDERSAHTEGCSVEYEDRNVEYDGHSTEHGGQRGEYVGRGVEYEDGTVSYENLNTEYEYRDTEYESRQDEYEERSTQYEQRDAEYSSRSTQYAEMGVPLCERSAADTEAAHDLLSLALGTPAAVPAATVFTVLQAPEPAPLLPVYTYTIQPTNIFILAEEPPEPIAYHTVQTITPLQPVEFVDSQISYVEYNDDETAQEILLSEPAPELELQQTPESSEPESPPAPKQRVAKYDCNECGKRYATSSNLSRHKQTHRSLDSVAAKRCGECGKAYVSMPALAMHVLTHRMGHVCGVCGKQFSRPWLLRGHLRSHTGEKPYSCAACGKAFADRSNLRAHLQTHSSDKKYECARCRKSFALKSYLSKHQEAACVRDDGDDDSE